MYGDSREIVLDISCVCGPQWCAAASLSAPPKMRYWVARNVEGLVCGISGQYNNAYGCEW